MRNAAQGPRGENGRRGKREREGERLALPCKPGVAREVSALGNRSGRRCDLQRGQRTNVTVQSWIWKCTRGMLRYLVGIVPRNERLRGSVSRGYETRYMTSPPGSKQLVLWGLSRRRRAAAV